MWKEIAIVFFAVNALFWGLFPHDVHCKVATMFVEKCAPHAVHVGFGVLSFFIAVLIAQQRMFSKLVNSD